MKKDFKSICYAFISYNFNVYFSDKEECFSIEKLYCANCEMLWRPSLDQCYLCGELNYSAYECSDCNTLHSIAGNTKKCPNCESENTVKACLNTSCISNTFKSLKQAKGKGIFNRKSPFKISLSHCRKCGNIYNAYFYKRIFIYYSKNYSNISEFIKKNNVYPEDIVIFKHRRNDVIYYDYIKIENRNDLYQFNPLYKETNILKLIDKIYEDKLLFQNENL